jgi:hypothetical protein
MADPDGWASHICCIPGSEIGIGIGIGIGTWDSGRGLLRSFALFLSRYLQLVAGCCRCCWSRRCLQRNSDGYTDQSIGGQCAGLARMCSWRDRARPCKCARHFDSMQRPAWPYRTDTAYGSRINLLGLQEEEPTARFGFPGTGITCKQCLSIA